MLLSFALINQNSPKGCRISKNSKKNSFSSPTRHCISSSTGMFLPTKRYLFVSIKRLFFATFGLIETWTTILASSIYLFLQGFSLWKLFLFFATNAHFLHKPKILINPFLHKNVRPFLVCCVKRFWGQCLNRERYERSLKVHVVIWDILTILKSFWHFLLIFWFNQNWMSLFTVFDNSLHQPIFPHTRTKSLISSLSY